MKRFALSLCLLSASAFCKNKEPERDPYIEMSIEFLLRENAQMNAQLMKMEFKLRCIEEYLETQGIKLDNYTWHYWGSLQDKELDFLGKVENFSLKKQIP
jgi:hypothetical protein